MIKVLKSYGINYNACDMEVVTLVPSTTVHEVLCSTEYFIHPTLEPTAEEFYALKGTSAQYKEFLNKCKDHEVAIKVLNKFGWDYNGDPKPYRAYREQCEAEWTPWFAQARVAVVLQQGAAGGKLAIHLLHPKTGRLLGVIQNVYMEVPGEGTYHYFLCSGAQPFAANTLAEAFAHFNVDVDTCNLPEHVYNEKWVFSEVKP